MNPREGESEGKVDTLFKMRDKAGRHEYTAILSGQRTEIDRMIAAEERRRQEIGKRLQFEIRRLESLRRA